MPPVCSNAGHYYSTRHPQRTSVASSTSNISDASNTSSHIPQGTETREIPASDFLFTKLHPIHDFPSPHLSVTDLERSNVTQQHLHFKTGKDEYQLALLELQENSTTDQAIHRVRPWQYDSMPKPQDLEHRYRPGEIEPQDVCATIYKDTPEAYYDDCIQLSNIINNYLQSPISDKDPRTVQGETAWGKRIITPEFVKYLRHKPTDSARWHVRRAYSPYLPGGDGVLTRINLTLYATWLITYQWRRTCLEPANLKLSAGWQSPNIMCLNSSTYQPFQPLSYQYMIARSP
ncbi:hypothetical protein VHEMI08861 [[Torrubiella] hemipterigena]|uniref:Uncharacterized protein n=1 Tax=[Torrubiella] hemipterigena TaxID=1531966 RepID=A0A0A1T841_9HYPO|nr:hypothetical protein VHEMI08861 [[Torrubiella] hemipterigena]